MRISVLTYPGEGGSRRPQRIQFVNQHIDRRQRQPDTDSVAEKSGETKLETVQIEHQNSDTHQKTAEQTRR